ncbi:MAG: VapC toxin family PIN domain ribonuclease [Cyanobacteriota bacterium]|nr:VapC toxin family PIN domain ribonuclease [Cyanobacteriota bacterium]
MEPAAEPASGSAPLKGPLLLDPNVLVALLDPQHCQHRPVQRWFAGHAAAQGWATCPASERLVLAVMTHPDFPGRLTLEQAAMRLARLRAWPGHRFWAEAVDLGAFPSPILWTLVPAAGALADLELLALAVVHDGVLVTLGRRVPLQALRGPCRLRHWQPLDDQLRCFPLPSPGPEGARLPPKQG